MTPRGSLHTLATCLLLAGCAILTWTAAKSVERRGAQREGRAILERAAAARADAEALAAIEAPNPDRVPSSARPALGSVVARIVVPAVGIDVVAREGVDLETLDLGAGHFPSTARPGEPGNSAFAGHRDVEFRGLRNISRGHEILLDTGDATFVYRVTDSRVVEPEEVEVLSDRGASEVTLVTCYPFDWVGPAPRRFVVRAALQGRFEAEDGILADFAGRRTSL